jgi:hypothetical protein
LSPAASTTLTFTAQGAPGLRSLSPISKTTPVALLQRSRRDGVRVNEHVLAPIVRVDEAEASLRGEPLHHAGETHLFAFLFVCVLCLSGGGAIARRKARTHRSNARRWGSLFLVFVLGIVALLVVSDGLAALESLRVLRAVDH